MKINFYDDRKVTIVTPTFEGHYHRFEDFIDSIDKFCLDKECLKVNVIIEKKNEKKFSELLNKRKNINASFVFTEDVLERFSVTRNSGEALKRIGKFTFQTLKKLGGLLEASTKWSIILDSETLFFKPFKVADIVKDYEKKRYIFYTNTSERGEGWKQGFLDNVISQCGTVMGWDGRSRCYMELIIWFYETRYAHDLIKFIDKNLKHFLSHSTPEEPIFENILYYMYIEKYTSNKYIFINIFKEWNRLVPEEVSGRYDLDKAPMSFQGADHLSMTLRPSDILSIKPFIEEYKIPFFRVEPALVNQEQYLEFKNIPTLKAFVSSAHIPWVRKRIAVCMSGRFHNPPMSYSNVRHIVGFLMGCDCDVYICGPRHFEEAVIIEALRPVKYSFDSSFDDYFEKINSHFPSIVENINKDDWEDLYYKNKAYSLISDNKKDYDYIVSLNPNLYCELTLYDILRTIGMDGDLSQRSVFFPKHFNSSGINQHFAIGGIYGMSFYMEAMDLILNKKETPPKKYNVNSFILEGLLINNINLFMIDFPYALMNKGKSDVRDIVRVLDEQHFNWHSSNDLFPVFKKCNDFFSEKLKSLSFIGNTEESILYIDIDISNFKKKKFLIRVSWSDSNPNGDMKVIFCKNGKKESVSAVFENFVTIKNKSFCLSNHFWRYVFCFVEDDQLIISEWKYEGANFVNDKINIGKEFVKAKYIINP